MYDLFFSSGTGHSLMILSFVIGIGLLLGKLKFKGISLGATWILFVGILFSALGIQTDTLFLHFIKEFGLILFVFSIGMQVGPGFFQSFRKDGLRLNLLSLLQVVLCVVCVLVIHALTREDLPSLVGSMTGAVTNTPGLGTAQQTYYDTVHGTFLAEVQYPEVSSRIAHAFAVGYPIGIIGILLVIVFLRHVFRVDLKEEQLRMDEDADPKQVVVTRTYVVRNPAVVGKSLEEVTGKFEGDYITTAFLRGESLLKVSDNPVLEKGDRITLELSARNERLLHILFGEEIAQEASPAVSTGNLVNERLVITKTSFNGMRLKEMEAVEKYGITVTRIVRSGMSLIARGNLRLQMGDVLKVIGSREDIERFAEYVGNSGSVLEKPNLIPIFLGIGLGIVCGAIPIRFPGMGHAARLGIAGGTLLVAILLGYFGPKWKIATYTTASANKMLREVGLSLLLATVGLGAGSSFASVFAQSGGLWILYALLIAVIPALLTGLVARLVFKMNFYQICGLITGATTNSPVLDFTREAYGSDHATVSYATVYPLSMFLQVVAAQLLILLACA